MLGLEAGILINDGSQFISRLLIDAGGSNDRVLPVIDIRIFTVLNLAQQQFTVFLRRFAVLFAFRVNGSSVLIF